MSAQDAAPTPSQEPPAAAPSGPHASFTGPGVRVLLACVAIFGLVVVDIAVDGPLSGLDRRIARHETDWAHDGALAITRLGDDPVLVGVLVAGVAACIWLGSAWNALLAASVGLLERGLVYTLKAGWQRARPDDDVLTYAFPSGHASGTAAAYGIVLFLVAASLRQKGQPAAWFPWLLGAWIGLVLAVAASRILLGLHWLTDVVAGAAIGVALATAANLACRRAPSPNPL